MNPFIIIVSSFILIGCNGSDPANSGTEASPSLSTDQSLTDEESNGSNQCSQECNQQIDGLKKNITELYAAFIILQSQLDHINKHMTFHEKALKHVAIWGHKRDGHHHHVNHDYQDIKSVNQSSLSVEQNGNTNRTMRGHPDHQHHHGHHHHHHHHHKIPGCSQCPHTGQMGNAMENLDKKVKDKDSSAKSPEENQSIGNDAKSSETTTVLPNSELKSNENIVLNDSQTNPSENPIKAIHFSKPSVDEQLYFQTEFKEWFNNLLNGIHHNHERVDQTHNGIKADRRLDQSAIDQMENALNSEELIYATCSVKPNRHIALLNQQDIEGTINMWQLNHNRGPLHMHIKLKGFKVSNHEDIHRKHNGQQNVRQIRESILMPVEAEPEDTTHLISASHSHGFHVHEFGNLSRDCQSVGSHYNPLGLSHGGPFEVIRHAGDLGNIRCDKNGKIDSEFSYSQVSLSGIHSIINRSLVIHSNIDDYGRNPNSPSSVQTGSSGVRIACCLIEQVKQLPEDDDSQSSIGSVASPVNRSKRRRDTSAPIFVNRYRFDEQKLSEILKKIAKHENDRKYKTLEFD